MIHANTWINPENIMDSETSQRQNTYCIISFNMKCPEQGHVERQKVDLGAREGGKMGSVC